MVHGSYLARAADVLGAVAWWGLIAIGAAALLALGAAVFFGLGLAVLVGTR